MFKDVNDLLEKIPVWRALVGLPDRVEALEKRIAELESRLERAPGDTCPACGALAMRLEREGRRMGSGSNGYRHDKWKCSECGHTTERKVSV